MLIFLNEELLLKKILHLLYYNLYINVKYLIGRMLLCVKSISFLIWDYMYWLNSKFLKYLQMKFWTQNESIGILYDSNEYFGILPYMFLGNWVHVQFWSSANIHQTSLRFQDTYVCAEDKIRYYKDVISKYFRCPCKPLFLIMN